MKEAFKPGSIGNIKMKNRFIRSATWENMTTHDGHMTQQLYKIYKDLAKGGLAAIITGYANIVKEEQPNPGMMGIYDDSFIEGYKKLTDSVHEEGAALIMQLAYGGTKTKYNLGERIIFAPSDVPEKGTKTQGKPMTKADIDYIVSAFAQAARRAKESGFDGVEIHGAHSYLINQFLSPYYNRREDEYGGSLSNRMRFLLEVYHAVREKVGEGFPVLVKLTASDFFEGGLIFDETRQICKELERVGVDAIELSGNIHGKAKSMTAEVYDGYAIQEEGYFLEYAKVVSNEIDLPLITVGGFSDPQRIEEVLEETGVQYIALSRPLLTEPDLINRWQAGDKAPVKCIRCSKCRTAEGNYCTVFQ